MNDAIISSLIAAEITRQQHGLELIPSENYVSTDVLRALGSVFTNKYSEGYPGRRYYGGQANTDQIEQLAIDRAKQLFGADHANVQPHSGAQANEAVYYAWCEPGDTILAMDLAHGGHLTHGAPVTRSAREYHFVHYGLKDATTGDIDYDKLRELALEHRPKILLAGFSAYPRELDYARFAEIGREVGALLMADMAHIAGLIAGGVSANPFDYGFHVITATTHKTLRGPRGGLILSKGVVSNPLRRPEKTLENIPTLIDRAVFPGTQGGPHMHSIAAKAVAFGEALQPAFAEYAGQTIANARTMAEELMAGGLRLVTGGTSNHLILADVHGSFGIDGKEAQERLETCGITTNANAIPYDTLPPFRPSGLRLGTPAMTTRGMKEKQARQIAQLITKALQATDQAVLMTIRNQIATLAANYPLPY